MAQPKKTTQDGEAVLVETQRTGGIGYGAVPREPVVIEQADKGDETGGDN